MAWPSAIAGDDADAARCMLQRRRHDFARRLGRRDAAYARRSHGAAHRPSVEPAVKKKKNEKKGQPFLSGRNTMMSAGSVARE